MERPSSLGESVVGGAIPGDWRELGSHWKTDGGPKGTWGRRQWLWKIGDEEERSKVGTCLEEEVGWRDLGTGMGEAGAEVSLGLSRSPSGN